MRHLLALPLLLTACHFDLFTTDSHGLCDIDAAIDSSPDSSPDSPPPKPIGLFTWGQSNDEGRAKCDDVTIATGACGSYSYSTFLDKDTDGPMDSPSTGPFVWQSDRTTILSPRAGDNFGVEMAIGTILHANGRDIGIAKAAVGSTTLAVHWFHHCYTSVNAAADVGCTYVNPQTGTSSPYPTGQASLVDQAIAQGQRLEAMGFDMRIGVFVQAESDASYAKYGQLYTGYATKPTYGHYDENEVAIFQAVHAVWPQMIIYYNRLDSAYVANYTNDVRTQQDHVATELSYVREVDADGLPLFSAHFTADGLWGLGERYATAILADL